MCACNRLVSAAVKAFFSPTVVMKTEWKKSVWSRIGFLHSFCRYARAPLVKMAIFTTSKSAFILWTASYALKGFSSWFQLVEIKTSVAENISIWQNEKCIVQRLLQKHCSIMQNNWKAFEQFQYRSFRVNLQNWQFNNERSNKFLTWK